MPVSGPGGQQKPPPKPKPKQQGAPPKGQKPDTNPSQPLQYATGKIPWYALGVNQGFFWTPSQTHNHSGIDLNTYQDTPTGVGVPISAPFDGTQISEGTEAWGGQENMLVRDANGNQEVLSWLHLESEVPMAPGTVIHAGQLLGYSGTPPKGYGSGPHIHFERTMGSTPPYMGYNPWYPRQNSYPVNPVPLLSQLKSGGEGGQLGGAPGGINPSLGVGGLPGSGNNGGNNNLSGDFSGVSGGISFPSLINVQMPDFSAAIDADVAKATASLTDALKRAGVFVLGIILLIIGLVILFTPLAEDIGQGIQAKAKDVAGSLGGAAGGAVKKGAGKVRGAFSSFGEDVEGVAEMA